MSLQPNTNVYESDASRESKIEPTSDSVDAGHSCGLELEGYSSTMMSQNGLCPSHIIWTNDYDILIPGVPFCLSGPGRMAGQSEIGSNNSFNKGPPPNSSLSPSFLFISCLSSWRRTFLLYHHLLPLTASGSSQLSFSNHSFTLLTILAKPFYATIALTSPC